MYKFHKNLFCLLLVLFTLAGCQKKAFDDFYNAPSTLSPAIYQTLQARGNFTNLLACIDKAGYTTTLSTAGYWTMFAPDDAAFKAYFTANNITSVSQMSVATCTNIVTYCLVYNAFTTAHLSDYQSPQLTTTTGGYVANQAFKRRTVYHAVTDTTTVMVLNNAQSPNLVGQNIHYVNENRNGAFVYGDFNNKYIPYFTTNNFGNYNLTAYDYNYFYPNTTYTGFNVVDGSVVTPNIICENGVIHEVSSVLSPLPSLEKYLGGNAQYSHFKNLYDQFMVTYVKDANSTNLYNVLTGSSAPVYVKYYSAALAFSPNNENFFKLADNDAEKDGFTLFAPTNNAFDEYVNRVLLEHYPSINSLPIGIINDFLNAHMWPTTVWPSKFATTNNNFGEPPRYADATTHALHIFDANNDVVDKKFCSNGVFYGTKQVESPNVFSTVYGRVYLDPAYSLTLLGLNASGLKFNITNTFYRYCMFLFTDVQWAALGYGYNTTQSVFQYQGPNGAALVLGNTARDQFYRLLNLSITQTPNGELDNLLAPGNGNGIYEMSATGLNGETIKYSGNTVFAAGNVEAGNVTTLTSKVTTTNGIAYYTAGPPLQYSGIVVNSVGLDIAAKAILPTDPYYMFFQYLKNSTLYTAATGAITGITPAVYTVVLVPTNAAIQDAVNNGWLPFTGTGAVKTPNYAPAAGSSDQTLVANFIKYHIVQDPKGTFIPDGKKSGSFQTLLKNSNGDPAFLTVNNSLNSVQIVDGQNRPANVGAASTAVLANYAIIQSIDTYLQYIDPYLLNKY
jgi:uncharacterized surface protein with fasciclin (FAS1) repeats